MAVQPAKDPTCCCGRHPGVPGAGPRVKKRKATAVGLDVKQPTHLSASALAHLGVRSESLVWKMTNHPWQGLVFGEYAVDQERSCVVVIKYPEMIAVELAGYDEQRLIEGPDPPGLSFDFRLALAASRKVYSLYVGPTQPDET